jgi:hypothetical protein
MGLREMNAGTRIQSRRRRIVRIGLAAMFILSATACIFDKGDYQGGGRLDKGATAATASSSAPAPTDSTMPTATDTTQPTPLDAGKDGG